MKPGKCWAPNEVCPHADLCSTLSSTCQRRPTPCPEYEEAGSSPAAGMIAESIGAWPCRYCGEAREKHPPVTEPCGDPACPACSPDQAGTGHLLTAIIDALYPGKRAALIENWYATFPAAGLFREKPGTTVRSQVRVGPFIDVISPKESRIWLVYNEACEKQADGTEVWFGDFVSCGEDPLEAEKMARAEREHAAKIIEIGVENRRLDAEADAAGRPRPTIHQGPPLWPEYPETWVDYVVNEGGWADALYIEDASGDGARDWLLRQGIAPGQPFLVRFFGFRPATPDYWGEYDGEDWSYEILARGPAPEDGDAAEIIAEAWAIAERHGSFCPFGYPRTCGSGCHKPLGGDVFTCEAEDGETP